MTFAKTRQNPRVEVRLSAELHHGGRSHTVVTRNLSLGGVCLEKAPVLADQSTVRIALFLVFDDVEDAVRPPLEVHGKVAWSREAEGENPSVVGIQFLELAVHQREGLAKFLQIMSR